MSYGASAAPDPIPRANAALAVGCDQCNGWGTVITSQGRHRLCLTCQSRVDQESRDSSNMSRARTEHAKDRLAPREGPRG